jgi:glycosyltransferase involved in cell wall biosynthesis
MSKLLFITQKIDKNDDVLGVYHRWVECLGEKIGKLNVICLYKGRNELSSKIGVFSLGKEIYNADLRIKCESTDCGCKENQQSASSAYHSHYQHHKIRFIQRLIYTIRFYRYIWQLRNDYNTVFVHMNPIYIILGGLFWKLSGKKIFLWYNHPMGNLTAKIGIALADKVFCTSPQSFSAGYKKTQLMPAGIDTEMFKKNPDIQKKEKRILCLGRISPIKKIEYLIEAVKILDKKGLDFELLIVGSPVSSSDKQYYENLIKLSGNLISNGKIVFMSSVPNYKTPEFYNSASLYVNLTPSGSLDKAILEAMACQLPVIVANKAFMHELKEEFIFKDKNSDDLAVKITNFIAKDSIKKEKIGEEMRNIVIQKHSLSKLIVLFANLLNS